MPTAVLTDDTVIPARPEPRRWRIRTQVRQDPVTLVLVVVVTSVLLLIAGFPLISILSRALSGEGLDVLTSIVRSPVNRKVVQNTLVLGVTVATVATVIGFLFAYAQAKLDFRGKRVLHLIALLPIVSPPFAVATAVITLFGRNGMVSHQLLGLSGNIYGLPALTLVLSLSFFPVAYMNLLGMLRSLDPAMDEAASSLGASKWHIFRTVTLPMLIPGFASSFLLLFVESIADLANPLVVGGDYTVLALRAYIAINGEYNVVGGAAYSLVLLVPALLVFLVQRYWVSRKSSVSVTGKPAGQVQLITGFWGRWPLLAAVSLLSTLILVIYGAVLVGGFVKILGVNNTLTFSHYTYLLSGVGNDAIIDTVILALVATPIAGILGMLVAWLVVQRLRRGRGVMDFLGMIGLAVPGTVLGIGYAVTFNGPVSVFGLQVLPAVAGGGAMAGGAIAIVMVYVARSMPAGQRSGVSALQQIDPAIDEASTSLGASATSTFRRVTLPLIRPAFLAGLTYAFARSMTTVSPIIFITTPQTHIMTSEILAEVDAGRFGHAFAFCTMLIVIVLSVIGLLNLIVRGRRVTAPVIPPG